MPSPECKVYFDGSHYIAIPHTTRRYRPRRKQSEEKITVKPPGANESESENVGTMFATSPSKTQNIGTMSEDKPAERGSPVDELTPIERIARGYVPVLDASPPAASGILNEQGEARIMTKRDLFNEVYKENIYKKHADRKAALLRVLRPYFKTEEAAKNYVESNLERKKRNLIARRIRLTRKANLQDFNYFVTLTYDGSKHTEESFRKKLKNCLSLFSSRKGWKYIGVWERSPEKDRLHFHGIFYIPDGTMPGKLEEKNDYNFKSHRRITMVQNTYFNERFGRNDFEKNRRSPSHWGCACLSHKVSRKERGAHRLFERFAAVFHFRHHGR